MCQSVISVIVPIYKVEKYLDRCVESIVNQTYKNLEIILVDDGSPDLCPQLCDAWAEKDNRIIVVHKENGGLSDARNAGMTIATGEYVSFIDSDDYVAEDFISAMYDVMLKEDCDIVECSVTKCYEDEHIDAFDDTVEIATYDDTKAMEGLINENPFRQHVWNKLYKSEVALYIPFEKGKLNEDEFWTYQVFGNAKKVVRLYRTLYFYFQRDDSIIGESYNIRRLDALEGQANRQSYVEQHYPTLVTLAKISLFGSCIYAGQMTIKYLKGLEKEKAKSKIYSYVKQFELKREDINSLHGKRRFWFSFANRFFFFCCKVRCVLKIGF